jgi:hypothetical protein
LIQVQSGNISLARKNHRRLNNGNPEIEITVGPTVVEIKLLNLFLGIPEAVLGDARQDHVDFYILHNEFRSMRSTWPTVTEAPDRTLLRATVDPSGTERIGGRTIRMANPILRMEVDEITVESVHAPVFRAIASPCQLFVDYEITPKTGYGSEMGEIHFGFGGDFTFIPATGATSDECRIELSRTAYATLLNELMRV